MRLWHDDIRPPPADGWIWARTNDEAKSHLVMGEILEISLDHDLGYEHVKDLPEDPDELAVVLLEDRNPNAETGLDLVRWMVDTGFIPPRITIHSWNADGAKEMAATLNDHGADVTIDPFKT